MLGPWLGLQVGLNLGYLCARWFNQDQLEDEDEVLDVGVVHQGEPWYRDIVAGRAYGSEHVFDNACRNLCGSRSQAARVTRTD